MALTWAGKRNSQNSGYTNSGRQDDSKMQRHAPQPQRMRPKPYYRKVGEDLFEAEIGDLLSTTKSKIYNKRLKPDKFNYIQFQSVIK